MYQEIKFEFYRKIKFTQKCEKYKKSLKNLEELLIK